MGQFFERETLGSKFLVYVPDMDPPFTPLLFLHGRGESGTDPAVHKSHGFGKAISTHPANWPFLAVFPQKPEFDLLWPSYLDYLNVLLGEVANNFPLDFQNACLMGLSQGGNGALSLAGSLTWPIAKVVSMCGWGEPEAVAESLKRKSVWLFHGDEDRIVLPEESSKIAACLDLNGIPNKLTMYAKIGHNCWDRALAEPELISWLQV